MSILFMNYCAGCKKSDDDTQKAARGLPFSFFDIIFLLCSKR